MQTDIPTPTDTANKLILLKQNLRQITVDPKYEKFKEELATIEGFLSGKGPSLDDVHRALREINKKIS